MTDAEKCGDFFLAQVWGRHSKRMTVLAPCRLYPYQIDGIKWRAGLNELHVGGILGDEMGLARLQVAR